MVCTDLPPLASTSATILFIDDNEQDLDYWSAIVRNFGSNYTVLKAHDCTSGLSICRDQTVDCVLLELDIPESGFKALLDLIPDRKRPEVAVIIFTHLVHPILAEMAKDNGALSYLVKQNTSAEQLETAIGRAVVAVRSARGH